MRDPIRWMLFPICLVMTLLFGGGLGLALLESMRGASGWTLANYGRVLADPEFHASLRLTLIVALTATALSGTAGLALALALRPAVRRFRFLTALLQAPIAVPHLAMALVAIHLLSPSGLLARLAYAAGWIATPAEFPEFLNDGYGFGIVCVYVLKEAPFVALLTLAVLLRVSPRYEEIAQTLGASRWQRIRYVTLPLAAPGLLSSSVIVLAFIFNAFELPFLLGRPYPAMLPVLAQRTFLDVDLANRPAAMAIALVMFVVTLLVCFVYFRIARVLAGVERPSIL